MGAFYKCDDWSTKRSQVPSLGLQGGCPMTLHQNSHRISYMSRDIGVMEEHSQVKFSLVTVPKHSCSDPMLFLDSPENKQIV